MTFGVNALDWTNIGRQLQTKAAELFLANDVGESYDGTTSPVLDGFTYFDGATGNQLTTYFVALETEGDGDTPDVHYIITYKRDASEDSGGTVVDKTPLTLLYNAVDADGNPIVTSDSSAEGVELDDQGVPFYISPTSAEYSDNIQTVFDEAVDNDTGWSPTYALSSGDEPTQVASVEEFANSDSTSWVRIKQRNGIEAIYYFIPYGSEDEYLTLVDTIPATFTFTDDIDVYTAEPTENPIALASTVEATSLNSERLSSTYESTLTDLNTAYEALLSPGGETDDDTSGDEDADTSVGYGEGITIWISDNLITPIKENRIYVAGGLVLVMSYVAYRRGWLTWLRGKKSKITWSPQISG